jgi:tetratricopeptide (TPR) repeat protein
MVNEEAEEFKKKGNDAFKERNWEDAIKNYNKAITLDPENAAYYSNRSAAWSSKGNHESALADADRCLSRDPSFTKAYSRKGKALYDMGKIDDAEAAYKEGLAKDSGNDACSRGLADIASKRREKKSSSSWSPGGARSGGMGASSGLGGLGGGFLQKVMERFKKGGKMQTYMMVMVAYFLFTSFTGRNKGSKSKDSVPEDKFGEEDDSAAAAGGQANRRFKEFDGMWVSYMQTESKSDTLVLLLHRTSLSAEAEYGQAMPRLTELMPSSGFRLVAPDRPCHGFSPCPSGGEPEDPKSWLGRLVRAGGAPDKIAVVAAGREAARQALWLARRQPEVAHILVLAPKAVAPARADIKKVADMRAWLEKQTHADSAQAAADAARWAAGESASHQAGESASPLNVDKLSQDCRVTILYGENDEEDKEFQEALEGQGVEVKTRSMAGEDALHDVLADEVKEALNPDASGVERSEE